MLEELELEYEHIPTNFMGESREPDFLAINPNGHIPALIDGETTLWESLAINLYLAEKYGPQFWPETVEDRGHAIQWSFWAITETEKSVVELLFHSVILPEEQRDPGMVSTALQQLEAPFTVLNHALVDREFLVGDHFGVADLNVAAVLAWCAPGGVDFSSFPELDKWLSASLARPAAKRAVKM
jgi:glutathione S-transferase